MPADELERLGDFIAYCRRELSPVMFRLGRDVRAATGHQDTANAYLALAILLTGDLRSILSVSGE